MKKIIFAGYVLLIATASFAQTEKEQLEKKALKPLFNFILMAG